MRSDEGVARVRGIEWDWGDAGRSALCAVPAVGFAVVDPSAGLGWALGTLPVAVLGLAPTRVARRRVLVVGVVLAGSVLLGALFSQTSVTTALGIAVVAYVAAVASSRGSAGLVGLTLALPACAIGLSYTSLAKGLSLAGLFVASAAFSFLVLLPWPEVDPGPGTGEAPLLPAPFARRYGVLAGLAGASSAMVGLAVGTDHVGWAPAAGFFVMRPSAEMQRLRSAGRIVSVACGAAAGVAFVRTTPPAGAIGIVAVLAVAGAGGTRHSRWYVTPFFGSILVLTLLLYADPTTATEQWRFNQRVGMTAVGIGFAYLYGLVVPRVLERRVVHSGSDTSTSTPSDGRQHGGDTAGPA